MHGCVQNIECFFLQENIQNKQKKNLKIFVTVAAEDADVLLRKGLLLVCDGRRVSSRHTRLNVTGLLTSVNNADGVFVAI